MKSQSYLTRALRARDPRFASILGKLGYRETNLQAADERDPLDHDGEGRKGGSVTPAETENLAALRAEYLAKVGRRPFHAWDEETLAAKIAESGN